MNALFSLLFSLFTTTILVAQSGTVDPSFNDFMPSSPSDIGAVGLLNYSISIQDDDKIILGGNMWVYNGDSCSGLIRLHPDGELDTTFQIWGGNSVKDTYIQNDGKILVATGTSLNRLNSDGSVDATFTPSTYTQGEIETIEVQSNGRILVGGTFIQVNGTLTYHLVRLHSSGAVDPSFTSPLMDNVTFQKGVNKIRILNDQSIMIGGTFGCCPPILKLNGNGTINNSFYFNSSAYIIHDFVQLDDGDIVVGGVWSSFGGHRTYFIHRRNADGSYDSNFNDLTGPSSGFTSQIVQSLNLVSNEHIVVGGFFPPVNGINRSCFLIDKDGNRDATFDANEEFTGTGGLTEVYETGLQSDGKLIISGRFINIGSYVRNNIARLFIDLNFSSVLDNEPLTTKLFPNPSSDVVMIDLSNNVPTNVRILDRTGKVVLQQNITSVNNSIDVSQLTQGAYTVVLNHEFHKLIVL